MAASSRVRDDAGANWLASLNQDMQSADAKAERCLRTDYSIPIISPPIALRYFVPEDAPRIFALSQEEGIRTWLPDQVYDTEEHAREVLYYLIEKCTVPGDPSIAPYVLGVCVHDSGELIGHVGLSPLDGDTEVGYAIADGYQGKGLASLAVGTMTQWALSHFSLPRILGIVATDNPASCKVLENAGFELLEESMSELHGKARRVRTYETVRRVADKGAPDSFS